jgi:hypothetical protein
LLLFHVWIYPVEWWWKLCATFKEMSEERTAKAFNFGPHGNFGPSLQVP